MQHIISIVSFIKCRVRLSLALKLYLDLFIEEFVCGRRARSKWGNIIMTALAGELASRPAALVLILSFCGSQKVAIKH